MRVIGRGEEGLQFQEWSSQDLFTQKVTLEPRLGGAGNEAHLQRESDSGNILNREPTRETRENERK